MWSPARHHHGQRACRYTTSTQCPRVECEAPPASTMACPYDMALDGCNAGTCDTKEGLSLSSLQVSKVQMTRVVRGRCGSNYAEMGGVNLTLNPKP